MAYDIITGAERSRVDACDMDCHNDCHNDGHSGCGEFEICPAGSIYNLKRPMSEWDTLSTPADLRWYRVYDSRYVFAGLYGTRQDQGYQIWEAIKWPTR